MLHIRCNPNRIIAHCSRAGEKQHLKKKNGLRHIWSCGAFHHRIMDWCLRPLLRTNLISFGGLS